MNKFCLIILTDDCELECHFLNSYSECSELILQCLHETFRNHPNLHYPIPTDFNEIQIEQFLSSIYSGMMYKIEEIPND